MMTRLFAFAGFTVLFVLSGCVSAPVDAPYYARILEWEEDLEVPWVGCRRAQDTGELQNPNCTESDPVIIRLDARVYDDRTLLPMNNVRIWFTSPHREIYLLPQEVLEAIELPTDPDSGWTTATQDQQELWAEFAGTFEDDYRPTYHEGYTDRSGMATVWIYVERMPIDEQGQALETQITVSIASHTQVVALKTSE